MARLTSVVDAIHARQAAEAAAAAEAARRAEAARAPEAADRDRRDRERREAHRRERAERAERLARRSRLERWAGLAVGAAGAASLAVAAKYGLDARSAAADITAHRGPWTDRDLMRDAEGRAAGNRAEVFAAVGGAALIGGGLLYLLGRHHDTEASRLRLEIQAQPGGGALAASGRFCP